MVSAAPLLGVWSKSVMLLHISEHSVKSDSRIHFIVAITKKGYLVPLLVAPFL